MTGKIRWGIMSTAWIAAYLVEPLRQAPRSELLAVASRRADAARAYATKYRIPRAYGGYDELLADPDVDAVYIPLPNSLHCEWTVKAAAAGKHVLCEKPLVLSLAELDAIEMAAQAHGVTIFEAFANLHHPQTRFIQQMLDEGKVGDLQLITGWESFYLDRGGLNNIRFKPELGGGSLWDVGVYPVSQAIVLIQDGPPVEVWATQIKHETGVDVALTGQMRFANGVAAQISSGLRSPHRSSLHLVGDKGVLVVISPATPEGTGHLDTRIIMTARDGDEETIVIPAYDAYLAEIEAMEACILDAAEPVIPLDLSRDFLRTVLALYQAAETGKLVQL